MPEKSEDWDFPGWRRNWPDDWRLSHPLPVPDATRWGLVPLSLHQMTGTKATFSLREAREVMQALEDVQRARWRRPVQVSELLDSEFTEFGASGRRWDATSILTVTSAGSVDPESPVKVSEMSGVVLAPGNVHLTYFADNSGRRAWRSSL